jgi:hypothetical protein
MKESFMEKESPKGETLKMKVSTDLVIQWLENGVVEFHEVVKGAKTKAEALNFLRNHPENFL